MYNRNERTGVLAVDGIRHVPLAWSSSSWRRCDSLSEQYQLVVEFEYQWSLLLHAAPMLKKGFVMDDDDDEGC